MVKVCPELLVKLLQSTLTLYVNVPPPEKPEFTSIITLFVDDGTGAPEEPPETYDQWVVSEASQVPVPPTQYLLTDPGEGDGDTDGDREGLSDGDRDGLILTDGLTEGDKVIDSGFLMG
jgi:hypothetical protein